MPNPMLIVTGPPGAGKSTVAELLVAGLEPSVLVSGDAFFDFLREGQIPPWLPESHQQNVTVTAATARAVAAFVAGGFETVLEGIFGPWMLPGFSEALDSIPIDYAVVIPPLEVCLGRVAARPEGSFRDRVATTKMHQEFSRASIPARHRFDSAERTSDELCAAIEAARHAGALRLDP